MATVLLKVWQRRDILNKLSSEFGGKIYKLDNEIAAIQVIQPLYEAKTTEAEREAVALLGDKWLYYQERALVKVKTEEGNEHRYWVNFQKRALPHGFDHGRPPNVLKPGMVGYDEVAVLVNRRAAMLKERTRLIETISTLLYNATTLNKVQDLWPSVTEYLDQPTITELNAPVVKKTRIKRDPLQLSDEAKASLIKLNLTRSSK